MDTATGRTWLYANVQNNEGDSAGSGWVPGIYYERDPGEGRSLSPSAATE